MASAVDTPYPVGEREPILCYVDGAWAWFTTADLKDQWGDDWDDAPYQHNAGPPYEWASRREVPEYELSRVAWSGPFGTPGDLTDSYSVEDINAGKVPWLASGWYSTNETVVIPAGTTYSDFIRFVHAGGGEVYVQMRLEP